MISHRNRKLASSPRMMTEMARYVHVPPAVLEQFLQDKGFTRSITGCEVTYSRRHEDNYKVIVKVYTSIMVIYAQDGQELISTRDCGRDSIKICTVVEGEYKTYGIGKFPYVTRTGNVEDVLARTLNRMRAAYARGTEWIREQVTKEVMSS
jgi:hypothetical protein